VVRRSARRQPPVIPAPRKGTVLGWRGFAFRHAQMGRWRHAASSKGHSMDTLLLIVILLLLLGGGWGYSRWRR